MRRSFSKDSHCFISIFLVEILEIWNLIIGTYATHWPKSLLHSPIHKLKDDLEKKLPWKLYENFVNSSWENYSEIVIILYWNIISIYANWWYFNDSFYMCHIWSFYKMFKVASTHQYLYAHQYHHINMFMKNVYVRFFGQFSRLSASKNVAKIIPTCISTTEKQFADRSSHAMVQH